MKTCNPKNAKASSKQYECNHKTGRWVKKKTLTEIYRKCDPKNPKSRDTDFECNHRTGRWIKKKDTKAKNKKYLKALPLLPPTKLLSVISPSYPKLLEKQLQRKAVPLYKNQELDIIPFLKLAQQKKPSILIPKNPFQINQPGLGKIESLKDKIVAELDMIFDTLHLWNLHKDVKKFETHIQKSIKKLVTIMSRNARYFIKNRQPIDSSAFILSPQQRFVLEKMEQDIQKPIEEMTIHFNQYLDSPPEYMCGTVLINKIPDNRLESNIVDPLVKVIDDMLEYFILSREFHRKETAAWLIDFGEYYFSLD